MTGAAIPPAAAPDLDALIRSVALDAIRRIQDALRFCPPAQIRGLLRGLREARELMRSEASEEPVAATTDDARHFIFQSEDAGPCVLEVPADGHSTVQSRWLSPEEAAAFVDREERAATSTRATSPPAVPWFAQETDDDTC